MSLERDEGRVKKSDALNFESLSFQLQTNKKINQAHKKKKFPGSEILKLIDEKIFENDNLKESNELHRSTLNPQMLCFHFKLR